MYQIWHVDTFAKWINEMSGTVINISPATGMGEEKKGGTFSNTLLRSLC